MSTEEAGDLNGRRRSGKAQTEAEAHQRALAGAGAGGHFSLSTFDQAQVWVTPLGEELALSNLSSAEVRVILEYLEQHAGHFHLDVVRRDMVRRVLSEVVGRRGGEELAVELGGVQSWEVTSGEWLAATPLVRGLRRRLDST